MQSLELIWVYWTKNKPSVILSFKQFGRMASMKHLLVATLGAVFFGLPVASQDLDRHVSGTVTATKHVTLSSQRSGQLSDFLHPQGTQIEAGSVLVNFDCAYETALIEAAGIELQQAQTELRLTRQLAARGAAGRADVVLSTQSVSLQEAQLKVEQARAQTCSVTAPFSGTIIAWAVKPFSTVSQGEALVEIADTKDLYVDMRPPAAWVDELSVGQEFQFTPEGQDTGITVKVDFISPVIDPISQTVQVSAVMQAAHNSPRIGTSGHIKLP